MVGSRTVITTRAVNNMSDHQCLHERDLGILSAFCEGIRDDMSESKATLHKIEKILLGNGQLGIVGRLQALEASQKIKARFAVIIPAIVAGLVVGLNYLLTGKF